MHDFFHTECCITFREIHKNVEKCPMLGNDLENVLHPLLDPDQQQHLVGSCPVSEQILQTN